MPPAESAAKRRRLAALEQAMGGGTGRGRGSGRGGPPPHSSATTTASRRPPPASRLPGRGPPHPPPAPAAATLAVEDPLYDPLPPAIVAGPLAALSRAAAAAASHARPPAPGGGSPRPQPLSAGDLGTVLASLAATTPRGPDASTRAAALTRLAERHLLLDNPTAGLKGVGKGGRSTSSTAAAALAAGGAAPGVAPAAGAPVRLHLSHAARRAVGGRLPGGGPPSEALPPPVLEALTGRWRSYAAAALGGDAAAPAALPPWLDLHGAPATVLACRDGRQVTAAGGVGGDPPPFSIITRDGPSSWGLADPVTGRVRWVGKAGTELGVCVGGGGGVVRVVGDLRRG